MNFKFEFRPYRRRFKTPLQTNHGIWDIRDGIILRLTDEIGKVGYGEIAPISWFGSETIEQALNFCRQLPKEITQEKIFSISDELPACQFGFESAKESCDGGWGDGELFAPTLWGNGAMGRWREGERGRWGDGENCLLPITNYQSKIEFPLNYSALLPAGNAALQAWQSLWERGYRTFKWKIGVYSIAEELEIFELLTQALPAAVLRLDANGGLSDDDANLWLYNCDRINANPIPVEIEFIEQPLPVEQFDKMQELSYCYATAIALDESIATIAQLQACYQKGWRGIFVIKPSIAGSPQSLRQFFQAHKIDAVFSSVFETTVGKQAALKLAAELSDNNRAVGFGVSHWEEQDEQRLQQLWKDH